MPFYPLQHLHLLRCVPALRQGRAAQDQLGTAQPSGSFFPPCWNSGGRGRGTHGGSAGTPSSVSNSMAVMDLADLIRQPLTHFTVEKTKK